MASLNLPDPPSDGLAEPAPAGSARDAGRRGQSMASNRVGDLDRSGKIGRRTDILSCHGIYRLAIGFVLVPLFGWWHGDEGSDWRLFPFFLVVLLMLRVVPAVVRAVLPFPEDLQARWLGSRVLAKRFDSYQWCKLVWFGLGLAGYLAIAGRAQPVQIILCLASLVAGGLGALRWRYVERREQAVGALLPKR